MTSPSQDLAQIEQTDRALVLSGRLDGAAAARLWREAMAHVEPERTRELRVDASRVDYCDGAGAALLVALRQRQEGAGGSFRLDGLRDDLRQVLAMVEPSGVTQEEPPPRQGFFESLGAAALDQVSDLRDLLAYTGELALTLVGGLRHPRTIRMQEVLLVAERAGLGAIPIMVAIGFLFGLILAFQSAIPMQRFGAEIFVADLIGISLLRELGPLMAAILLTARSGSAFTAEIGTMKVNEEVDALNTMGLEPMRFLVLPRVIAAVAVVPILAMLVNLSGLAGGAVMFMSLGFPLVTFVDRVVEAVGFLDFAGGIFKALVFGVIVAAVGCRRGLQTGKGAGAVGVSTTSSVVTGITLVAVTDGIFAVLFYVIGI